MFSQLKFSQSRARPDDAGDETQLNSQGGRRSDALAETSSTSCGITAEHLIQWQQSLTASRHGKEEKLRQDTLSVESNSRRVTHLKTGNAQLAGKEEQLAEDSKLEDGLLCETEAQLGFLEEQLREVAGIGEVVKQMQEQDELVKVEQDSRLKSMEERFRQVQVNMTAKIHLSSKRCIT